MEYKYQLLYRKGIGRISDIELSKNEIKNGKKYLLNFYKNKGIKLKKHKFFYSQWTPFGCEAIKDEAKATMPIIAICIVGN